MVNFEDGKLVKGAYVVINGIEYPVHMPEYSGNVPLSSENMNKMQKDLIQTVFPVGSTYITQEDTNPNTILGFGIWERLKGKVCLGLNEDDEDFNEIGKTGGEKAHILTIEEMPEHKHEIAARNNSATGLYEVKATNATGDVGSANTKIAGGNKAHNNMQPYEITGYMWIRRS